jgi:signal transduction histidine kinase
LQESVAVVNWLNLGAFVGLALLALRVWYRRRDAATAWAAAAFGTLGLVVLVGRLLPEDPTSFGARAVQRLDVILLLAFPYLLYRFTWAFANPSRRLTLLVSAMTGALVVWTLALPDLPEEGETLPAWFTAYLVGFLLHWTLLTIVVGLRLWRAGNGQPAVARRRMRLLSLGAAGLAVALLLVASIQDESVPALGGGLLAFLSAIAFALAVAPPSWVRQLWRQPEARRVQDAVGSLMQQASTEEEVASRVLSSITAIVGARGAVLRNAEGQVIGSEGLVGTALEPPGGGDGPHAPGTAVVELDLPGGGSLQVWTTPYAPFFGDEELRLLRTLGALTGLALDRARLFAQERHARLALEQAHQLKANFVALAAHELRTPITTVHGLARTLVAARDRLSEEQRLEMEDGLVGQTERLVELADQLLDLSRLDAEVIEIVPASFRVRTRTESLIASLGADARELVDVQIDSELEAMADPRAFDRIVSNLIANALRYGEPPIVVRAEHTGGEFRIAVEDRGPGVEEEFVPSLFERFSRGALSARKLSGTGLGLAIARSYARAHDGDVIYRAARPRGARFELVLPG